ncbi:MAG: DUF2179 domain-containing protein [Anaerolineales bacterium]
MFDWYMWVWLPLLVFFARVADVSLGTIRIIFTSRGLKHIAPLLGFVEVFIWISAIAQITKGAHNIVAYLAYAGGFAAGAYLGMFIESKLALGMLVIRAIVPAHIADLTANLRKNGYGFTRVDAQGSQGPVNLIYAIVKRKNLPHVIGVIRESHPEAFFTVEELRSAEHGVFPSAAPRSFDILSGRKSK